MDPYSKAKMHSHILLSIMTMILGMTSSSCLSQTKDSSALILTNFLDVGNPSIARKVSSVDRYLAFDGVKLPKSHAGYLNVNSSLGNNMFFWFFPSDAASKKPLLLWLNGGPSVSSMLGFLWENGPVQCVTAHDTKVKRNPFSWTKFAAVLYIDNPTGVGYSFSSKTKGRSDQEGITQDLYNFLEQFFRIFPQYKYREFYIGGQSYAGKYVPSLAYFIHNKKNNGQTDMPLTGVFLGGPLFDPPTQLLHTADYLYTAGAISHKTYSESRKGLQNILNQLDANGRSNLTFGDLTGKIHRGLPIIDNYAMRLATGYRCVETLMDSAKVRSAVHSGACTTYSEYNHLLSEDFGHEFMVSTKSQLGVLMDNYKVLIYNGDFDSTVTSSSVEESLMTTPWAGQVEYNAQTRSDWKDGDKEVGYFSKTGNFCRVVVKGAGHQVPHDQPESSFLMMKRFIRFGCVS